MKGMKLKRSNMRNSGKWRIELEKAVAGHSDYILLNKLGKTIAQFNIPLEPFFELLKGMEMDLQYKRYLSFDDLVTYCYRVASTVGLMRSEEHTSELQSLRHLVCRL